MHTDDRATTPIPGEPHGHQASLADGLAFINTLEETQRGPVEHLSTPAVALRWLHAHQLLHTETLGEWLGRVAAEPRSGEKVLARITWMRSAIRELVDATVERRPPDQPLLDEVNRALRTPYTYTLVQAPDGVSLDHRHDGDPIEGALARLAESLARDVSLGHPERLRVCANPECRWVFSDASRAGRRKWCDMATCGNRAKVARHRERKRQDPALRSAKGTSVA